MTGFQPDLCVLLSVYNGERTLRQALDSVLSQTYRNFELFIIDDASTDGTVHLLEDYQKADTRIRILTHKKNQGLTASLNEGLRNTEAPFIARMDADDESLPERFEKQIHFLRHSPDVGVVGSFAYKMGALPQRDRLLELPVTHEEIEQTLPRENCLYHPAVMMRRKALAEAGYYRNEFLCAQDYDLWLRMLRRGHRFANLPEPLIRYRFSLDGLTLKRKWEQFFYVCLAQICYEVPEAGFEEAQGLAQSKRDNIGKRHFLRNVACGTCLEMVRLGLYEEALQVIRRFAGELVPKDFFWLFLKLAGSVLGSTKSGEKKVPCGDRDPL